MNKWQSAASNWAVDGISGEAYLKEVMKRVLQLIILAAVCCATAVAEDELDAALNKLKKKSRHRTYSTTAVLENRVLTVPTGISAEEKSLDDKIRALNKKTDDNLMGIDHRTMAPRPMNQIPAQEEPNNWLTPALLDEDAAENSPTNPESSWITKELDRQKLIQMEKTALKKNTDWANRQLNSNTRAPEGVQYNQLKSYDRKLKNILSGSVPEARRSSSITKPLIQPKTTFGVSYSGINHPGSTTRPGAFSTSINQPKPVTQFGTVFSKTPKNPTSIWDTPSSKPLPPLKKLRQGSPLKEDPFTDDYMPKIKRSIWD